MLMSSHMASGCVINTMHCCVVREQWTDMVADCSFEFYVVVAKHQPPKHTRQVTLDRMLEFRDNGIGRGQYCNTIDCLATHMCTYTQIKDPLT
jgi:hypothetical protein